MRNKNLLTLMATLGLSFAAMAIPAAPGLLERTQPDGSKVYFTLHGDEHIHWAESADGYTLLQDDRGFWTVATLDSRGALVASPVRYAGREAAPIAPAGVTPGLKYSAEQLQRLKTRRISPATDTQLSSSFPSTGERKMLMILVTFADKTPTFAQSDFDAYMNGKDFKGIGSFRDFYLENSYGKLDITTTVSPWVKLPYSKSHYTADNVSEIITYTLNHLIENGSIRLADYDNDGDGVLDGLAIIHQGAGQEVTGSYGDIWSHTGFPVGLVIDGIRVHSYTIQPETLGNNPQQSTIGVMCHEFGHNLGAPDFYDVDYAVNGEFPGTGAWDLMASGAWNGSYGDRPAGINMWQKIQYGWVEPTVLGGSVTVDAMPGSTFNPVAYRMDTSEPGDYFIIENRQREGNFDAALPSYGMLIYHANESGLAEKIPMNLINASYPQTMYLVCAGAGMDPNSNPDSYGNLTYAAYPYGRTGNALSDHTLPSARSVNGRNGYFNLYDITRNSDGTMSFSYEENDRPEAPRNLEAKVSRGIVSLTWEYTGFDALGYFTIYRNGEKIATTADTSYTDNENLSGNITYMVDATLNNGYVSAYDMVKLRIPLNKITGLYGESDVDGIHLTWDLDTRLSHMADNPRTVDLVGHAGEAVSFAHRFRAEEMAPYEGYSLRAITFVPAESARTATYTLRVWEAEPGGLNPQVVSERTAGSSSIGLGSPSRVLLLNPVTFGSGKEYWFGVTVKSQSGVASYPVHLTDLTPGLGNWFSADGYTWSEDTNASGDYYLVAELLLPDEPERSFRDLATYDSEFDVMRDLSSPIGFAVYRDGEYLGSSASRYFHDNAYSTGTHTYSVTSLYKGDNESGVSSVDVYGESTSVDVLSGVMPHVRIVEGGIVIDGYDGGVSVDHVSGMRMYSTKAYDGSRIVLGPGLYVVRVNDAASKVMVR